MDNELYVLIDAILTRLQGLEISLSKAPGQYAFVWNSLVIAILTASASLGAVLLTQRFQRQRDDIAKSDKTAENLRVLHREKLESALGSLISLKGWAESNSLQNLFFTTDLIGFQLKSEVDSEHVFERFKLIVLEATTAGEIHYDNFLNLAGIYSTIAPDELKHLGIAYLSLKSKLVKRAHEASIAQLDNVTARANSAKRKNPENNELPERTAFLQQCNSLIEHLRLEIRTSYLPR